MLDLEPINNALENIQQTNVRNQQRADVLDERTYQRGRDQRQDARVAQSDARERVKWFGTQAAAVDRMQGPQRAAAWQHILSQHPDHATLTPDYMDPIKGPALVAAEAGQWRDPRDDQIKDLELQKTRAEIGKLNAQAASEGTGSFGKTGAVVQGADGRFYAVRYSADGTEKINPLDLNGQNMTPAKGVEVVGDTLVNKATGADVRNMAPNISAGEQAKTLGRETAQGAVSLPKTKAALDQYEIQTNTLKEDIGRALQLADGSMTTGLSGAITSNVPGTPGYNLAATLNTVKANVGFDKLQAMRDASPTGGALGQVSEQENILLQSVLGSLSQSQTKEQLVYNLNRLNTVIDQYRDLKRQAYQQDVARFGAANVPNPETGKLPTQAGSGAPSAPYPVAPGNYIYNPATGKLEPR